jgi:hypothetical protein
VAGGTTTWQGRAGLHGRRGAGAPQAKQKLLAPPGDRADATIGVQKAAATATAASKTIDLRMFLSVDLHVMLWAFASTVSMPGEGCGHRIPCIADEEPDTRPPSWLFPRERGPIAVLVP